MKRVIVMGASSGIGREVCLMMLERGWQVGIAARRKDMLDEIRQAYPDLVKTRLIDVTTEDAPALLAELIKELGGVDVYLHASGFGKQNYNLDTDIERHTVAVNCDGFAALIGSVFHYMNANDGGHIVSVSSIAGTKGLGIAPSYSATKAFQSTYIQALEQLSNMRGSKVRFTDIRPGFVDTPFLADAGRFPMLMDVSKVAKDIMDAIDNQSHVKVIDWRYRILVFFWHLIPNSVWRNLKVKGR